MSDVYTVSITNIKYPQLVKRTRGRIGNAETEAVHREPVHEANREVSSIVWASTFYLFCDKWYL